MQRLATPLTAYYAVIGLPLAANEGYIHRMRSGEKPYVWQDATWPSWRFDAAALASPLAAVHRAQGHLLGRMAEFGAAQRDEASVRTFTADVLKTSEIEGEQLDPDTVRSSVARRLGVDVGGLAAVDRHVDGVVDMVLDATRNYSTALSRERLCGWHAALFPTGRSGLHAIRVGDWRDDHAGPMQVVSGRYGRERVHYEAPPATQVDAEMQAFLQWFNDDTATDDAVIRAGLAHLWCVTIHPFDDGNGRIARAVGDMALARAERSSQRYYSLSAQIQSDRKNYYELLERTQKGSLDVTEWLQWFLNCLLKAVEQAELVLSEVLAKARFWQRWAATSLNERQIKLLNLLLDGLDGNLTTGKWAKIAQCSPDTALRDITALLDLQVLKKSEAGGRSTSYVLS
jgi:Fic family protein